MDNLDKVKTILKHCSHSECYGCPLRLNNDCVPAMAFTADRTIRSLIKRIEELEKQNAELTDQLASMEMAAEEG